jgi:hypothetical protein
MKKIVLMMAIVICVNTATAKADLTFKVVSPVDFAESVVEFVGDTGENVFEGLTTTVFGLGEIITSPFRAKFRKPKTKTYYFDPPRMEIERGRLYRVRPRLIPLQPKTYRLPAPVREYNIDYLVVN